MKANIMVHSVTNGQVLQSLPGSKVGSLQFANKKLLKYTMILKSYIVFPLKRNLPLHTLSGGSHGTFEQRQV